MILKQTNSAATGYNNHYQWGFLFVDVTSLDPILQPPPLPRCTIRVQPPEVCRAPLRTVECVSIQKIHF